MTADPLNPLTAHIAEQYDAAMRRRFPLLARTLDNRFYVDPDEDGRTFWLRDRARQHEDTPHGGERAASEAQKTMVLQELMAHARLVDAEH